MKKSILMLTLISALSAPSAFAAKAVYHCDSVDGNADNVTLTLGNAHFVKVDEDVAQLDESYEPTQNSGYSRFEYQHSDEGTSEVLVQDRILKGSRTGFIKVQNRGEGFGTEKYACTQQD